MMFVVDVYNITPLEQNGVIHWFIEELGLIAFTENCTMPAL